MLTFQVLSDISIHIATKPVCSQTKYLTNPDIEMLLFPIAKKKKTKKNTEISPSCQTQLVQNGKMVAFPSTTPLQLKCFFVILM